VIFDSDLKVELFAIFPW